MSRVAGEVLAKVDTPHFLVAGVRSLWRLQSFINCTASLMCTLPWTMCRYLVEDTLSRSNKSMARCVSRLSEALNLLPHTDTQSLSATLSAAMSSGRLLLSTWRPSGGYMQGGEQQDLRQQQVSASLLCRSGSFLGFTLLRQRSMSNSMCCSFWTVAGQGRGT